MKFIICSILFCSIVTTFGATIHRYLSNYSNFNVDIYTTTDAGSYPVVVFVSGFVGTVPGSFYSNLSIKVADQKIIVVGVSQTQNVSAEYVEQIFTEFMINITDPNQGIKNLFKTYSDTANVVPNIESQLVFFCHSAGCHVITLYLVNRCGTPNAQVKALIMADPVDGTSPFDTSGKGYVTHPPAQLPFNISVLIMSSGLSNQPLNPLVPACAPANMSNDRFYQSLSGPKWLLNFTNYGHNDITDEYSRVPGALLVCTTCSLPSKCNYDEYRQDTANAIANFTTGILNGQNGQQSLQFLSQPQLYFKSNVTIKPTMQQASPSNGFCLRYP